MLYNFYSADDNYEVKVENKKITFAHWLPNVIFKV